MLWLAGQTEFAHLRQPSVLSTRCCFVKMLRLTPIGLRGQVRCGQNGLRAAFRRPSGSSGERGIRTLGTRKGSTVFKTDAIVRSAISPSTIIAVVVYRPCGAKLVGLRL